jgi:hypothetical protein
MDWHCFVVVVVIVQFIYAFFFALEYPFQAVIMETTRAAPPRGVGLKLGHKYPVVRIPLKEKYMLL